MPPVYTGRLPPLGALVKPCVSTCATHRHTVPSFRRWVPSPVTAQSTRPRCSPRERGQPRAPPHPCPFYCPDVLEKSELDIVITTVAKMPLKLVRHARVGDNQTCATDQWEHGGAIPMPHFSYEHSPRLTPSTTVTSAKSASQGRFSHPHLLTGSFNTVVAPYHERITVRKPVRREEATDIRCAKYILATWMVPGPCG